MNSKRKGNIGLSYAVAYFASKGATVLLPISDCDKYDLVIDNHGLKKVQCKYTSLKANANSYEVNLRTYGGYRDKVYTTKYKSGDFDFLFVACVDSKQFLIPCEFVIGKSTITVGGEKTKQFEVSIGSTAGDKHGETTIIQSDEK